MTARKACHHRRRHRLDFDRHEYSSQCNRNKEKDIRDGQPTSNRGIAITPPALLVVLFLSHRTMREQGVCSFPISLKQWILSVPANNTYATEPGRIDARGIRARDEHENERSYGWHRGGRGQTQDYSRLHCSTTLKECITPDDMTKIGPYYRDFSAGMTD